MSIPNVELARVGMFYASTGPTAITNDDLINAILASTAKIHPKPVLKFGHEDPRFDGSPSIGWVDNLHLGESGQVLIGDLHGVPQWVAAAFGSHYPNRSIEARRYYMDADGTDWPFVLTGLALLGEDAPAIGNLAELRDFVTMSRAHNSATPNIAATARARRRRRTRNTL